jgi:hypothetical protein
MTVSFELYTLVKDRWQIYVRYEEHRRDEAMTEAQTLEKEPHIERVRVVLDEYDSETNASKETVVYETVLEGDAREKSGKGEKGHSRSSGGKREENNKALKPGQGRGADLEAFREKAQALREVAQGSVIAIAASNAVSSAVATATRARQLIGGHPNRESLARGLPELAIAICISTLISLCLTACVFFGLEAVHQFGVFSFQNSKTFWGLVVASFILTFSGSFIPIRRKVSFGSSPSEVVHAQSAQLAHEFIEQVPQFVVAPMMAIPIRTEVEEEIKPKQLEEKRKIVERTAKGPQHLKDASGWLLSCMTAA